jgi:hypothetical protein
LKILDAQVGYCSTDSIDVEIQGSILNVALWLCPSVVGSQFIQRPNGDETKDLACHIYDKFKWWEAELYSKNIFNTLCSIFPCVTYRKCSLISRLHKERNCWDCNLHNPVCQCARIPQPISTQDYEWDIWYQVTHSFHVCSLHHCISWRYVFNVR